MLFIFVSIEAAGICSACMRHITFQARCHPGEGLCCRVQAKLKEAEDEVAALKLKLEEAALEKRALEEQLAEFTRTLSQRDELIAQLRAGQEVTPPQTTPSLFEREKYPLLCNLVQAFVPFKTCSARPAGMVPPLMHT